MQETSKYTKWAYDHNTSTIVDIIDVNINCVKPFMVYIDLAHYLSIPINKNILF